MKLMTEKKGIVFGLSNTSGIAYAISKELHKAGAKIAFNYLPVMEKRVKSICEEFGSEIMLPGNVQNSESLDIFFNEIKNKWGKIDFMLHAVAFSDKNELHGKYINTTRENFKNTMDVSVYSLVELSRRASKLMTDGGSIVTLTYYGGEKSVPNYNVMGVAKSALESSVRYLAADLGKDNIRVNAISAGPIMTLASSGVGGFKSMLKLNSSLTPMRRNVTLEDVAGAAVYLFSNLSSGLTGEVHHIDCGYSTTGMIPNDLKDILLKNLD